LGLGFARPKEAWHILGPVELCRDGATPGARAHSRELQSSAPCKDGCNIRLERRHARRPELRNP